MPGAFRLGVVLRLREMAEDQARARLGQSLARQREATDTLVALTAREAGAQAEAVSLQDHGAAAGDIVGAQKLVERARQGVESGRQALEAATAELFESRSALAEATKRREVVERLRDRSRHAEALDAQRREDALLSEIAGVKHARGMASETES